MSAVAFLHQYRAAKNLSAPITDEIRIKNAVVNRARTHYNHLTVGEVAQIVASAQHNYGAMQMDTAIRTAFNDQSTAALLRVSPLSDR